MSHMITRYVGNFQRKSSYIFSKKGKDVSNVLDPFNLHRPPSLEELCSKTKFTAPEIKFLYQNFKQQFPRGILTKDNFIGIFKQIYSSGRSDKYAALVFKTLDKDNSGFVDFEIMLEFMSDICFEPLEDNYDWIFRLYDINGDGFVSKEELLEVAIAIYHLENGYINPPVLSKLTTHIHDIFKRMDSKSHGAVDKEDFCKFCANQPPEILNSINILKSTLI